eukprot:361196-Chlamydomonas_euryale.AAC.4
MKNALVICLEKRLGPWKRTQGLLCLLRSTPLAWSGIRQEASRGVRRRQAGEFVGGKQGSTQEASRGVRRRQADEYAEGKQGSSQEASR